MTWVGPADMVTTMRISDYLEARGERQSAFAMRAGVLPQTLFNIIKFEQRPRLDIALQLHDASLKRPTKDGGVIELRDMLPVLSEEVAD